MKLRLLVLGALIGACLPPPLVTRLVKPEEVAIAYVFDPEVSPTPLEVPDAVRSFVSEELKARNLFAADIPFSQLSERFLSVKDSKLRFETAMKLAPASAQYVLLVETRASFFAQLNGRYRYIVYARLTGGRRDGTQEPIQWTFDQPTYTNFDHERELEAVEAAKKLLGDKAGQLFDSLLQMAPVPKSGPEVPVSPVPHRMGRAAPEKGPVYFVMVDRFVNGDVSNDGDVDRGDPAAFHGGDLQGVIDRLDDLKAMGISTVWLSPIFKMRTKPFYGHGAFHGYWVEDLSKVEPRFGTTQLLSKLADELRRRDMGLVLDMVYNHVAPESPLLKEKPEWFHHKGPILDWNDVTQLTTHDVHGLPDLNQQNEEVYQYLLQTSLEWVKVLKPMGFRLDAVKHMPLSFWVRFNADLKREVPSLFLVGELFEGSPSMQARIQREARFDAMFDFPLHFALVDVFCKGASASRLATVLSQDRLYDAPQALWTFADNHDLPRVKSACGENEQKVSNLLSFLLLARGIPSLTWGTESGLLGDTEPFNRSDYVSNDSELKQHISRLLALRKQHASLSKGKMWLHHAEKDFVVFLRAHENSLAVLAVNTSSSTQRVALPEPLASTTLNAFPAQTPLGTHDVPPGQVRVWVGQQPSTVVVPLPQLRRVELASQGDALVGSGPELGDWNAEHAVVPDADGKMRLLLPAQSLWEYKWLRKATDGTMVFEPGDNHILFVAPSVRPEPRRRG